MTSVVAGVTNKPGAISLVGDLILSIIPAVKPKRTRSMKGRGRRRGLRCAYGCGSSRVSMLDCSCIRFGRADLMGDGVNGNRCTNDDNEKVAKIVS